MSGKSGTVSPAETSHATVAGREPSARWAALDSRHERLVTASDAVLAEAARADRGNGLKAAS